MVHAAFRGADDAPKAYWNAVKWASNSRLTVLHGGSAHSMERGPDGFAVTGTTPLPAPAFDYAISEDGDHVMALTKGEGTKIVRTAAAAATADGQATDAFFDNGSHATLDASLDARVRSRMSGLRGLSGDSYHWASPASSRFVMRVREEEWSPMLRHCSEPARFVKGTDAWQLHDANGQQHANTVGEPLADPTQQYAFMAWAPCATKIVMRLSSSSSDNALVLFDVTDDGMREVGAVAAPGVLHAAVSPDGQSVAALTRSDVYVFGMSRFN